MVLVAWLVVLMGTVAMAIAAEGEASTTFEMPLRWLDSTLSNVDIEGEILVERLELGRPTPSVGADRPVGDPGELLAASSRGGDTTRGRL
jgi:hypothetical protein